MYPEWGDHQNAAGSSLLNQVVQRFANDHGAPERGMIWYNDTLDQIAYYNGASVIRITPNGGNAAQLQGQNLAYVLDRNNHTGNVEVSEITDFDDAVLALTSGYATDQDVEDRITELLGNAPEALNTLSEIADALGDDANFAATITNLVNQRAKTVFQIIGDGAATSFPITHNFNSYNLGVTCWTNSAPRKEVMLGKSLTDLNVLTLTSRLPLAANSVRVVIQAVQG